MSKPTTYNDKEAKQHEDHCYVWVIAPSQRTKYSCNCSRKQTYQAKFPKP